MQFTDFTKGQWRLQLSYLGPQTLDLPATGLFWRSRGDGKIRKNVLSWGGGQ